MFVQVPLQFFPVPLVIADALAVRTDRNKPAQGFDFLNGFPQILNQLVALLFRFLALLEFKLRPVQLSLDLRHLLQDGQHGPIFDGDAFEVALPAQVGVQNGQGKHRDNQAVEQGAFHDAEVGGRAGKGAGGKQQDIHPHHAQQG